MIDTPDKQLGLIESEQVYEPALPFHAPQLNSAPTQRQLLWGYPYPNAVRFSISSQQPVFVPVHRIMTHTSESAEFVSTGD